MLWPLKVHSAKAECTFSDQNISAYFYMLYAYSENVINYATMTYIHAQSYNDACFYMFTKYQLSWIGLINQRGLILIINSSWPDTVL